MAEDLIAVGENRQFKLGSSFGSCEEKLFHTIRYDFVPASIDVHSTGNIKIGGNKDCTVTLPHHQNANDPQSPQQSTATEFKGSMRPSSKECILLINKKSKTITLERIGSHMQLKRTRTVSCQVNSQPTKLKLRKISQSPNTTCKMNVPSNKRLAGSQDIKKNAGLASEKSYRLSASSSEDEDDVQLENDYGNKVSDDSSSNSDHSDSSESEEDTTSVAQDDRVSSTVSQNTRSASDNKRRSLYEAAKNDLEDGILSEDLRLTDSDTDS
ncbi:ELL-associated factor 1 [Trichoplax sp. H2]|nr:ELL-associated factor 1 [Trichoplax sp. H2]|eukprot:RDD42584.1 ELL-associated factor 1 [Trichoplax sp. H2]